MYILEFFDKKLPPTTNVYKRRHWAKDSKDLFYWTSVFKSKKAPPKPLCYFTLKLVRYSVASRIDFDNLVGSFKILIDAARVANIIIDDSYHNTGRWDVDFIHVKKRSRQGIYVCITERRGMGLS